MCPLQIGQGQNAIWSEKKCPSKMDDGVEEKLYTIHNFGVSKIKINSKM